MKELYQGWIRATKEDQENTKLTLVNFVQQSVSEQAKTRMHRLAFYLSETFEHWSFVQDTLGRAPLKTLNYVLTLSIQ